MSNYDETNRGAIWKNDNKQKESQPDFKGSININGVEYWLSGWRRKADAHPKAPALSLSVQPKEQAHQQGIGEAQKAAAPAQAPASDFEDDIPFANPYKGGEYLI